MRFEIGTKYSDVITEEMIESWGTENVIFNGATGSGKTYFIENNLHTFCVKNNKKILYLCNRKALFDEVRNIKDNNDLYKLDIMLYQVLQEKLKNNEELLEYDYIICDEFHYITSDARFNKYTDIAYDYIVSREKSCVIFMSGTAISIFNKLKHDNIVKEEREYVVPYSYNYVEEVQFYTKKNTVIDIIENILNTTDDKIIYFCNSTANAVEVYKNFKKQSVFRCSNRTRNNEAKILNDEDCIQEYNKELITFNARLLIATKAIDNGITLKDRKIKHIISDIFDLESMQQCLGRKRSIDKDDTCKFYIRKYSKKEVSGFKGNTAKIFNPVNMLITNEDDFNKKYGNDREFHNDFIYFENGKRTYNKVAFWKLLDDMVVIESMEKEGYKNIFLNQIGETISNIVDSAEEEQLKIEKSITAYLDFIVGKRLYNKSLEKEEFINTLAFFNKNNRLIKGFNDIKKNIEKKYGNIYNLICDKDWNRTNESGEKNINYGKTYWILERNCQQNCL